MRYSLRPNQQTSSSHSDPSPPAMRIVTAMLLLAAMGGCAKSVVHSKFETSQFKLQRPERILVYNFAVSAREVTENKGFFQGTVNNFNDVATYEHERQIADEVQQVAADELVEKLRSLGLPAERAAANTAMPPRSLGITGQFLDVDEGNKLRRTVVGLGVGQSKVGIRIQMYALGLEWGGPAKAEPVKLVEFETQSHSGSMPGALVTGGAGAAAGAAGGAIVGANVLMGGIKNYRSAMGQMTARSVDQAAAYLSEFSGRHGWIPDGKVTYAHRP